ncbi:cytochrome c oxidase subunit II [Leptolyngbya boryana CZ1]|uniref:Cytochrome c oxidase subunit 2 n=1 Tax=Leptolyngbya boryana CZ1 TaxID=3060204 RepID=A0AA96X157_LEPBY|nr:cytochrome c oxidase subunit II [Leptolyngbya boryana]WNZ47939.1 cytochrome c oxidase subunit II [Leptolyngbya boryana CZ1]
MNIPSQISTLLAGIVLTLVSLWYGQNHNLLPVAATEAAPLVDNLFNAMLTIGTGIFLLVNFVLVFALLRFRRKSGDESDGDPVHGNIPLEIVWTAIPAIIVLGISIYSFDIYNSEGGFDPMDHSVAHGQHHQMKGSAIAAPLIADVDPNQATDTAVKQNPVTDAVEEDIPARRDAPVMGIESPKVGRIPAGKEPLTIAAAGMQYAWLFTYPDEIISGELHLPVGRPVVMNITANDVLHAFWVPEFRLKQDAVPGRQSEIRFTPTVEGDYPVICAELCGAYHGAMKTHVLVESQESYDAWLQSMKVAQADEQNRAIALSPAQMTDAEYLAPYAQDAGVTPEMLHQLHPMSEGSEAYSS